MNGRRIAGGLFTLVLLAAVTACGGTKKEGTKKEGTKKERTFTVTSPAMEPTLHCARPSQGCEADSADRLVVEPVSQPGRGDIVVFRAPREAKLVCGLGGTSVKRIIGLPEERVVEKRGYFSTDGKPVDDAGYVKAARRDDLNGFWRVPKREYFVVGDNRLQSCDSRRWGGLPLSAIVGKAVAVERPSGRIELSS